MSRRPKQDDLDNLRTCLELCANVARSYPPSGRAVGAPVPKLKTLVLTEDDRVKGKKGRDLCDGLRAVCADMRKNSNTYGLCDEDTYRWAPREGHE